MDGTTIWAIVAVVVVLIGLALLSPLYWSSRRTQKIEDPETRAAAERAEEGVQRMQWRNPDML
ncbi:MAG TPA: hypothetical protein VGR57_00330 [Ktedonobacterales bacterium]|nr:hypothetical protein [Ktedonobacterales bacterium]